MQAETKISRLIEGLKAVQVMQADARIEIKNNYLIVGDLRDGTLLKNTGLMQHMKQQGFKIALDNIQGFVFDFDSKPIKKEATNTHNNRLR